MSWFSLSVRPDALALAVSALGFFVYVRGKKGPATLIATAVLLFVAWSIKQSYVGVLGGLCLHTILRDGRSPRGLIMPISFAAMVAGALILGGENYRAAIIGLGGLTWFIPYIGVDCLVKALVPQIPLVTTIVIAYVAARPRLEFRDLIRRLASANGPWAAAACVATWSLVFHFYASARFGPSRNHFFETNLAIFILAMLALDKLVSRARPHFSGEPHYRQYSVISALLLGWYPLLTLLGTPHFGNTGLTKPSSDTIVLRDAAKAFPKPVLSLALPYSLPWNTTEPGQPAYMIDSLFYGLAKGKKKLPRGGIEQSLEETRPATIIVPSGERETIRIAVDKAYRPAEGRMRELADRLRLVILFRADRTPPSQ